MTPYTLEDFQNLNPTQLKEIQIRHNKELHEHQLMPMTDTGWEGVYECLVSGCHLHISGKLKKI